MPTERRKLNNKTVKAMTAAKGERHEFVHTGFDRPGMRLVLIVGPRTKGWYVKYLTKTNDGKYRQRQPCIGIWPDMECQTAVDEAIRLWRERRATGLRMDSGGLRDPLANAKPRAVGLTVADLSERWLRECRRRKLAEATTADYSRHLKRILPVWGDTVVDEVDRFSVRSWLRQLLDEGAGGVSVNRCQTTFATMMSFAVDEGAIPPPSPLAGLSKLTKEKPSTKMLTFQELVTLWQRLDEDESPIARAVQLAMLTVVRRRTLAGALWEEFDDEGWWTIPDQRMKAGRHHTCYVGHTLTQQLLERIGRRRSGPLFPGRSRKPRPPAAITKWVTDFRDNKTPELDWSAHILRRSVTTYLSENHPDVQQTDLAYLLQHQANKKSDSVTITEKYIGQRRQRIKRLQILFADDLVEALSSRDGDNVLEFTA